MEQKSFQGLQDIEFAWEKEAYQAILLQTSFQIGFRAL